jgi:hypothetical protein
VTATGTIVVDESTELPVGVVSISEGGVSIECARQLDRGGAARLRIALPDANQQLELKGEIVWSDMDGRAGIRFQVLPIETKRELEEWLERRALILDKSAIFINATGTHGV